MKLINYHYGLYHNQTSSEVYRGKILMTENEWDKAYTYLRHCRIEGNYNRFYQNMLREDVKNRQFVKDGYHIAIRVYATEKIVKKFNLKGYKRQNYFIHVISRYQNSKYKTKVSSSQTAGKIL